MSLPNNTKRVSRFSVSLISATLILFALIGLAAVVSVTTSAQGGDQTVRQIPQNIPVIAPGSAYRQTNLASDLPGIAFIQDPLLVNPWGISLTASSPFWVANNGTSTSTLYRETSSLPLIKNPGLAGITIPGDLPTGTVANPTATDFVLPGACASPPCGANFLFASITGNITGWDPNAPAAGSTTAVIAATQAGHVYTGLALANNGGNNFLYAADFANGEIRVYNSSFVLQPIASFPFADPTIPTTMGNTYHPFNIQAIGNSLYVAYAKVGPGGLDEEGVGNGFVRRFNTAGVRDLTFGINNGALNSPWGITQAPASFGIFGGALLIGNFGEGNPSIHAYNPTTGAFLGTLQDESGNGIVIDELWGLTFGNGGNGGSVNTLYFAAGTAEEKHGLFGSLNPTTASATSLVQLATDDVSISEDGGHVDITVTRAGNVSGAATVRYATFDEPTPGHASQKTDFEISLGILRFEPGETSKTFRILIVDDLSDEPDEVIDIMLSNPTGAGLGLGTPNVAEVTLNDNDPLGPALNPIDDPQFFVRQNFLDFLNREPDLSSTTLVNQITACGGNAKCIYGARADVSASFITSPEFQDLGFLDILTHEAAYGLRPLYGQYELGTQALQRGVTGDDPDVDEVIEANKEAYFDEFVTRPEFVNKYPSTQTNAQFVDALLASAQLTPSQVRLFVVNLTNGQENPPAVPTSSGGGPRPASFGTATLQFNAAQTEMRFTSTVNNIDFTGTQSPAEANDNLTVAHIHAGPAVTPATNGPVVWGFFGAPFNDTNPNDQVVTPFTSGVGGSINGKWDAPEGNGTTLAAQLSNLREGRAYVNFHSTQFPGGEVRGNVPAANALRDQLIAGLDAQTETRATVLRKVAEQEELRQRELNANRALMGFFVYFRRDPDTPTFNFLLTRLNSFTGNLDRELARIFITALEYRERFGPAVELNNTAPDAVDDVAATEANTPVVINVLANDTDFENEPDLQIISVTPGVGGTPTITGNTVTFTPAMNFTGVATFQYTITDNGTMNLDSSGGLDDPLNDTASVTVNVGDVNNPPVNTVPAVVSTNVNTPVVFTGANLISIADPDAGASPVQVTLTATNGTFSLSTTNGLNFTTGDGTGDSVMTFTGTIADINAALNGLTFTPTPNFIGAASLQITTNDQGNTGPGGPLSDTDNITITVTQSFFQMSSATYSVGEEDPHVTITIQRTGFVSSAATIDYATSDLSGLLDCDVINGTASQRCDYTIVAGRLNFAANQSSKTVIVPIINDVYVEGNETFTVSITNPTGASLGINANAVVTIADNDVVTGAPNPIDNNLFFINQHYLDFLGREPDQAGLQAWLNILNNCGGSVPPPCDRVEVSSAFFRSAEFQGRGYFIYRFYAASLGRNPNYNEFIADMARISGFLSAQELEAAKVVFINEFMNRAEFTTKYNPTLGDASAYVTLLEQTAGVNLLNRQQLIDDLTNNVLTRAQVLRAVIESGEVAGKFFNEGFVVEAYFGYLRRDPDALYLQWLQILNQSGDYRLLVNGFVNSPEYRKRFGT